ncbi:hypothetical protein CEXT_248721 [Caerostris extrusa]|uniref:Uncharacterized protein n=1 Tax=Caerostris extrusa TaxID=172846 RepID=A0AAV4RSS8_CAEEX|nr:hypothetical protein CEXT_248721 [Caerostris extrusa]
MASSQYNFLRQDSSNRMGISYTSSIPFLAHIFSRVASFKNKEQKKNIFKGLENDGNIVSPSKLLLKLSDVPFWFSGCKNKNGAACGKNACSPLARKCRCKKMDDLWLYT